MNTKHYFHNVKSQIKYNTILNKMNNNRYPFFSDWLHAVRALECCAVIFVSLPLVILPVYMYVALGMYYRCVMGTMCAFCLVSSKSFVNSGS